MTADQEAVKRQAWFYGHLRSRRGIHAEDVCRKCAGLGTRNYASTATWRGGLGGARVTKDVCDECWGSGDTANPWPSWRESTNA